MFAYTFITQSTTPVIGDLARFFGYLMNFIYNFFGSTFGIYSLGLSIIVFTVITRLLMLPLAFKQQKSMKEMQLIQPELQAIQNKYKTKKDPESQQKMQAEISALYQKHGVNPFGGCLPLVVQMPIIFSLFYVLRNVPAYIDNIRVHYEAIANQLFTVDGYGTILTNIMDAGKSLVVKNFDPTSMDNVIDLLYKFSTDTWQTLYSSFPSVASNVEASVSQLNEIYYMFGINLAEKPELMSIGLAIPVLNVVVSFLMTKTSMGSSSGNSQANQASQSMMYTMPLMSGFFSATMPAGLGLYWLIGSLFQLFQQLVINKHIHKMLDKK